MLTKIRIEFYTCRFIVIPYNWDLGVKAKFKDYVPKLRSYSSMMKKIAKEV
jgi:hypothetical protein